jgi:hypothetical protein
MTEAQDLLRRTICPECGRHLFLLYSDGDITCENCGRVYARNVPELADIPARPLIGLARSESPNPLMRHQEDWCFTFGIEHPMRGYYVRLRGTVDGSREQMRAIFGTNWARQYSQADIRPVIERRGLRELELK